MTNFKFHIEGTDGCGFLVEAEQDINDHSEEQARRAVIEYCNTFRNIYPRKIKLVSASNLPIHSPFDFT